MTGGAATAVWIIGETLMIGGALYAARIIAGDVRRAWPRLKQLFGKDAKP